MEINVQQVIITIINFIILYFILRRFLFKPVNDNISNRQNEINANISKAEEDRKKAEQLKVENQNKLNGAKVEGRSIVEDYKVKAEKVSSEILTEARTEAEAIINRSKVEAEREKEKAADQIKNQVVDLAVLLSSKALEESVSEEQHRRLIKDFIAKVGI